MGAVQSDAASLGAAKARQTKANLTIDDSPSVRQMIRMTLRGAGCAVSDAPDGAEGLRMTSGGGVAANITETNMPVMNGIEFIRKFRARPDGRGAPLVILTTERDEAMKSQAREAGATG